MELKRARAIAEKLVEQVGSILRADRDRGQHPAGEGGGGGHRACGHPHARGRGLFEIAGPARPGAAGKRPACMNTS